MSTFRILRTAKATLSRTFALDEVDTDASGAVTVTFSRLDGTVVQTTSASGPDASHAYSVTWQGSDVLDELVVTWSATLGGDAIVLDQDVLEVVGGFYLGLGEIRAIDPVFQGAGGTSRYPTQDLVDRRTEVEDEFERICGQSFVPRFCRETLSGNGSGVLKLRWPRVRRVSAVTVGGTVWAAPAVAEFGSNLLGLLKTTSVWPVGSGNVLVEYEHGMDRPPTDIRRAARLRIKSHLLSSRSPLPDRAERIATTEVGTVMLAIASRDATGIPEVDAVLQRFPSPRPGFG